MIPILIPYYKAPEKIEKCKAHIEAQVFKETGVFKDIEVFIRDNSEDNILYTAAMNEGIRKYLDNQSVKYMLFMTQDVYMDQYCLQHLFNYLEQSPNTGIAAAVQRNSEGYITWAGSLRAFPTGQHNLSPIAGPTETPWANGACMLVRKSMIQEIGLMDKNMRFICSDSDYSFTARARGWKVMVIPEARCEHTLDGSGSFGKNPSLDLVKTEDLLYFTSKWLTGGVYKTLSIEGASLSNGKIKESLYGFINAHKRLMRENPGLTPLILSPN